MISSSPSEAQNRGRFWLALSLSTVTALAVTLPLAFRATEAANTEGPSNPGATPQPARSVELGPVDGPDDEDPNGSTGDDVVVTGVSTTVTSLPVIAVRPDVDTDFVIKADPERKIATTTAVRRPTAPTTTSSTATTTPTTSSTLKATTTSTTNAPDTTTSSTDTTDDEV